MIKTVILNHQNPSLSRIVDNHKVGLYLYRIPLIDVTIVIYNEDTISTVSPHKIPGGIMEIQRTIDLLVKPIPGTKKTSKPSKAEYDIEITDCVDPAIWSLPPIEYSLV